MSNKALKPRIATVKAHVELVSEMERRGISLLSRGESAARLEGHCPFHDDSTPSLSVYRDSQQFHCFGCGAHGDVLDFVQRIAGISLTDALNELEQGMAPSVSEGDPVTALVRDTQAILRQRTEQTRTRYSQRRDRSGSSHLVMSETSVEKHAPILSVALSIYGEVLSRHTPALSYLAERGIAPETVKQLALGYCDGHALRQALSGHAQYWQAAQRAGLLTRGGKEWFSGRIVIPEVRLTRAGGQVCVWMIGRLLPNLPSRVFVIRREQRYLGIRLPKPLLGYAHAIEQIQASSHQLHGILLVEGAVDYVLARQWGLPAVPVALLSTHPSRTQYAQLLHLHTISGLPILDCHDADVRGRLGALDTWERLDGYPRRMIPEIEGVKDLAELAVHPFGFVKLAHAWQGMSDGDPL
jgi:DNA primase